MTSSTTQHNSTQRISFPTLTQLLLVHIAAIPPHQLSHSLYCHYSLSADIACVDELRPPTLVFLLSVLFPSLSHPSIPPCTMARLSHIILLALVLCSSLVVGTFAVDDSDSSVPKESSPPPQRRVKISQQDYPYGKPKEATGVKFSEYQSLAVPPYILIAVLILFLAAAAYVIYKIFDTQQEKGSQKQSTTTALASSRTTVRPRASDSG